MDAFLQDDNEPCWRVLEKCGFIRQPPEGMKTRWGVRSGTVLEEQEEVDLRRAVEGLGLPNGLPAQREVQKPKVIAGVLWYRYHRPKDI